MKNHNNIEQLFSEKFASFEPKVPTELIDRIQQKAIIQSKKQKIKKFLNNGLIIFSVSTFVLVSYFYLVNNSKNSTNSKIVSYIFEEEQLMEPNNYQEIIPDTLNLWEEPIIYFEEEVFEREFIKNTDEENNEQFLEESEEEFDDKIDLEEIQIEQEVEKKSTKKYNNNIPKYKNSPLGKALYSVDQLKNGAIFIRLKTKQKTIDAYINAGLNSKAKEVEEQILEENKRIYNDFKANFDFCDIYFFYSSETHQVKENNWKGIFLNADLQRDSSIIVNTNYFLIADIGQAQSTDFISNQQHEISTNSGMLRRVIVLSNKDFKQMEAPFPYYQKALWESLDGKNISKLNHKISQFYYKRGQ